MKVFLLLLTLSSCTSFSQKNIRNVSSLIDESCVFINYTTKELDEIHEEIKSELGNEYKLTKIDQTNENFFKYGFSEVSHNIISNKNTYEAFATNIGSIFYFDLNKYLLNNLSNKLWKKICGNVLLIPNLHNTSLFNKELSPFIISTLRQMRRHNFKNKYAFVLGDSDNILSLSALKLGASKVYVFQLEEKTKFQEKFPLEHNSFTEDDVIYINPNNKIDMANIILGYKKDVVVISNLGRNYEKSKGKFLTNKYAIQLASYFHNITEYIWGGYRSLRQFNLSHIIYDRKDLTKREFQYNPLMTRFKPKKGSFADFLSHPGEDFVTYSLSAYYKKEGKKAIDVFSDTAEKEKKKENKRNSSDFIIDTKSTDQIKELIEAESGTIYDKWVGGITYKSFLKEIKKNKKQKKFVSSLKKTLDSRKKAKPYFPKKPIVLSNKSAVLSIEISPNGKYIASGSDDSTIRIWDVKSGSKLRVLSGHEDSVYFVSWDPTGKFIASGSNDNTIRIWDAKSGSELGVLRGHEYAVNSVSSDPLGKFIASGSHDGTIRIWDAKSGSELRVLRGHEDWVHTVSWDPTGKFIASGSYDGTIRIWNANSGSELRVLRGHEYAVNSVSWDPTGKFIASGSNDNTIRIWDAKSGSELSVLRGHKNWVYSVSWDPTGKFIASGSYDGTIRIWNANSGSELRVLRGHGRWASPVSWDPTGKFIASGLRNMTIRIWEIEYR